MKKFFLLFTMALLSFAFCEEYVVKSVKGKVQYEAAPGKMEDVKVGQKLSSSTNINTGVNSTLILILDDKELTVKPMQKGTIEKVAGNNVAGLKKSGTVKTIDVGNTVDNKSAVSTASSRASEAKEDYDWDD